MRKVLTLLFVLTLSVLALSLPSGAAGQGGDSKTPDRPTGKITKSYRSGEGARPAWVEDALSRSMAYLKRHGEAAGVRDPQAELALLTAKQDDLGLTLVRLDQVHKGVPVFGGQIFVEHTDRVPERHEYFVDARDGSIVWHFNSLPTGTGYSLFSGNQFIPTTGSWGNFYMRSPTHGNNSSCDLIFQDRCYARGWLWDDVTCSCTPPW
jgi:hypothetical protein